MQCILFISMVLMYGRLCPACPTCCGRVTKHSASFFSDECYCSQKKTDTSDSQKKDSSLGEELTIIKSSREQGE